VYGIKPWELEDLPAIEIEVLLSSLPQVLRRLNQVENVTYR
jgi:hypothetical protein